MNTIKLHFETTSNTYYKNGMFFVEPGDIFDAEQYARKYRLNRNEIDPESIHQAQDAASQLMSDEILNVAHEFIHGE